MQRIAFSFLLTLTLNSAAWAVPAAVNNPQAATTSATTPTPAATNSNAKTVATPQNPLLANVAVPVKPLSYEQLQRLKIEQEAKIKALVKNQDTRLKQLEQANLAALSQNQELQLKNDNQMVQIQVLQSERSAQMFLYGAVTLAAGVILGFIISGYIYTKRRRQW